MITLIKYWLIGTGISALLGLYGCGGTTEGPLQTGTAESYSEQQLSPWKELCVEDNMVRVESDYLDCENYTPHFDCQAEKDLHIQSLENAWNRVVATANANLTACFGDQRAPKDFCYSLYDQDLSFYVGVFCDNAF